LFGPALDTTDQTTKNGRSADVNLKAQKAIEYFDGPRRMR